MAIKFFTKVNSRLKATTTILQILTFQIKIPKIMSWQYYRCMYCVTHDSIHTESIQTNLKIERISGFNRTSFTVKMMLENRVGRQCIRIEKQNCNIKMILHREFFQRVDDDGGGEREGWLESGAGRRGRRWYTPMTIADQIARRLIVRRVVPSELKRGAKIEMLAGGSLDSEIEKVILDGRLVTMDANDEFILSRCARGGGRRSFLSSNPVSPTRRW